MIIDSLGQEAKTNLKTERASFSVAADKAKKFLHIAVRNLYSNPVLASVVEVSQNAHDEHVRRGIEKKPFVVTIPTSWQPNFSVRDFGGGIPHDYMLNGYTQALESTKDADAEMSGGWGLGRLALLSLASTYNVITYIDGVERNYSIFESENGIEIIMTHQRETKEVNGTLVSAPIPPDKVSQFRECCNRAFRYYKIKPTIKGDSNFKIEEPVYSLKGDDWAIEGNGNETSVVCGIYHYNIDSNNIPNLTKTQAALLGDVGLVMFFGASELSPMANRQGLYYNDKTVDAIKKKLDKIESESVKKIQETFNACKSMLEAKKVWAKMFASSDSNYKVDSIFKNSSKITWNDMPVEDNRIDNIDKFGRDTATSSYPNGQINNLFCRLVWGRTGENAKHYHNERNITISVNTTLFINDLPGHHGHIRRVKSFVNESRARNVQADAYVLSFPNDTLKQEFFNKTGLCDKDFINISTVIPTANSRNETASLRAKTKIFKWDGKFCRRTIEFSKHWEISDIDLEEDEEGVYIAIDRYVPLSKHCHRSLMNMHSIVEYLRKQKHIGDDFVLYGVRSNSEEYNKIKAMPDWIDFDALVEEFVKSYKIPANEIQTISDGEEYSSHSYYTYFSDVIRYGHINEASDCHSLKNPHLKKYLENVLNLKKAYEENSKKDLKDKHSMFISLGGVFAKSTKPTHTIEGLKSELTKNVPIIKYLNKVSTIDQLIEVDAFLK
jgi:hypothetical protein